MTHTHSSQGMGSGLSGNGKENIDPRPAPQIGANETERRKNNRIPLALSVHWDFFSLQDGARPGLLTDLSSTGCRLETDGTIELRRWLRIVIPLPESVLRLWCVGRSIWSESRPDGRRIYGIEFVRPLPAPWIEAIRPHSRPLDPAWQPLPEPRKMLNPIPIIEDVPRANVMLYASLLLNGNSLR